MKNTILIISMLLTTLSAFSQSNNELLGEWESKDSNGHGKYSIFEHEGKIYAYMYYWKDKKETFDLEQDMEKYAGVEGVENGELEEEDILKHMKELIILKDFSKKGKTWKGKMIYDEKNAVDSTLKYISNNEIEVSYSYYGYSDKSIWKRLK